MRCQASLAAVLIVVMAITARGEDLDSIMYRDPDIPVAKFVKTYPQGIVELWLEALKRPERDLQSRAAQAVADAHERGMPGLKVAIGPLTALVEKTDQHPAVLVAAARALVVLDARDSAAALLALAKSGDPELREIVESALARWDRRPARELWLERLNQPPPHTRAVVSAARWLGVVKEERAAPRLLELARSDAVDAPVRLAAARAVAEIRTTGLVGDAARLAGGADPRGMTGRLVAASFLRRHDGDDAIRLMQSLARDPEPTVARVALARLAEIDTRHILPILESVLASTDAGVRTHGVDTLFRHPSAENIRSLGTRLSDPHPEVRMLARRSLLELAAKWRAEVIAEGVRALDGRDWRGQEQAAILLARLDHKPASTRLVELLKSNRSEVLVAVGWALRQLAVPETLSPVLEHVRARHSAMLASGPNAGLRGVSAEALDLHLCHLMQLLGRSRHQPADPVLRAMFPRFLKPGMPPVFSPVGPEARAAAIWALGLIHAGKAEDRLVAGIEQRLTGDGAMGRDDPRVRRMAAIALARMGAKQSLEPIRDLSAGKGPEADVVANACRWALNQLTGEPIPTAGVIEVLQRDWFLVPFRD